MKRSILFLVAPLVAAALSIVAVPVGTAVAATSPGYLMLDEAGHVYQFGSAPFCGHTSFASLESDPAADIEITPNNKGYWALLDDGYVDFKDCGMPEDDYLAYAHNAFLDDQLADGEHATAMSALPDGSGYWVFTDRGKAIPFGNAQFYGDMSNAHLNGPILGSVATPTGKGYWMVGSDGGIFAFGDAKFYGSTGGIKLNKPVMSMAPDPDGEGYWLVASDGGIFAFDAPFKGSMGGTSLNKPVTGMVPGSNGYMMVGADGGIFSFGDVPFLGSLGQSPPSAGIVAVSLWTDPAFNRAGNPPTSPAVYSTQTVSHDSGSSETFDSSPFRLNKGVANLSYSCSGTGGYVGDCYFELHDATTGDLVDDVSNSITAPDPMHGVLSVPADGNYYLEVAIFASTMPSWSYDLTQDVCTANC